MIQTLQILVFLILKCLFYYVELRVHANLKTKILVKRLPQSFTAYVLFVNS